MMLYERQAKSATTNFRSLRSLYATLNSAHQVALRGRRIPSPAHYSFAALAITSLPVRLRPGCSHKVAPETAFSGITRFLVNLCQYPHVLYYSHGHDIGQTRLKIIEQIIEITEYTSTLCGMK